MVPPHRVSSARRPSCARHQRSPGFSPLCGDPMEPSENPFTLEQAIALKKKLAFINPKLL
ncbi:hypothetical protein HN51_036928 [Arachis hypogaea]